MSEYILHIEHISKAYKKTLALNSIDIKIKKGAIYGLIGQNGAGKTTLIRILNRILEQDTGSIHFNGEILNQSHIEKIGYLPEERGLYKNMTIEEQALYFGQLKGMSKQKAIAELDYWLQRFDILNWKKKKIQGLSKGMAQKVQFIITVLHQPKLIILDEPFSGFDPVNANLIAQEIKQLSKDGATIIFSSHRMESVNEMCDSLCLLHKGGILLEGAITDIQKNHTQEIYNISMVQIAIEKLEVFIATAPFTVSVLKQNEVEVAMEITNFKGSQNSLLQLLVEIGEVTQFQQYTPTLEEIFIKTIQNA